MKYLIPLLLVLALSCVATVYAQKPVVMHRAVVEATGLSATLERWDGSSSSLAISNGIIFAEGDVTEAMIDDREIRVFVNGVEQAIYTEALDGRWPDGSVKSVLIQFSNTFTGSVSAEVRLGEVRQTTDISIQSIQPNPDGLLYLTSESYLCSAYPLWFDIAPQSSHPTSPDSFGVELDSIHAKYLDIYDDIWTALESWTTGEQSTLTTRTDNTSGVLGSFQGLLYTGNTIDLYWNSGVNSRLGAVVGTVASSLAPFSGGTGDNLPAEGTTTVYAKGSGPNFFAVYTGASYEWNRHSYGRFCMAGDSTFLKRTIEHGWHMTDGYPGNNDYALPEWYSINQQTMLLHYWLTGYDDSRTAAYQFIDGSAYSPTDWSTPVSSGAYRDGRILAAHLQALVVLMHLEQGTIPSMGGTGGTWPNNAAKARGLIDAWIAQQETSGARYHDNMTNADVTLSSITGTFQQNELIRVNGVNSQNYLSTISGGTYVIGRASGGAMVVPGDAIVGQTSGATATVATVGTLRFGTQPWMNMLAASSMIAYSRFISSDRDAEIKACIEADYAWMDQFWDATDRAWPIYDTEANWHVVPDFGSPDLNGFSLAVLEWLIEQETDPTTKAAYIARADDAVKGIDDGGYWNLNGKKQFSEMNWGVWQYVARRISEQ